MGGAMSTPWIERPLGWWRIWDACIEEIQWMVPLGLEAVAEELHGAVEELAGRRYQRKGSHQPVRHWGCQPGSVFLGDQKVP